MTVLLLLLFVLVGVHLLAVIMATAIIAARIEEENPPEGVFVEVPGGRLHLYDLGATDADRLPILLLHGATSNARDMVHALGADLARRRRVIAVDRPGHGWSDRPGGRGDASPAQQAALIMAALRRHGIGRFVVVGHSWAGSLAAHFALDYPREVAGLVVLAGATHPWPGGINWYYRLAAMPVLGRIFVHTVMTPVGAWGLSKSAAEAFVPHPGPADYVRKSAAALVLRPKEFRWNGQDVADLKAFLRQQAPRYGDIAVPTAILADPADPVVHTGIHAEPLSRMVPHARLTLLAGAGHQIHYTAKAAVLAEIERVAAEAEALLHPLGASGF
ncbi:alpha/beta fold hydrolase [Labrys monachus]|uniref:Pimeloyl-ACP methyl ester carboxylesterase n=1 Tax=Labrys monachus TaxID=217067 RepID=A0ABU0FN96_9HYPH|nr:alpha/beta hydrolase [Labrys monachus]MDQ0396085.1 pimeloyl-ACP methyl ester carboxylesterase [Labrys monachus]